MSVDASGRSPLLVGDRLVEPDAPVLEWTVAGTWAPVCDRCDVAMVGQGRGRLSVLPDLRWMG